jgi:DNA-binding transcriptional ArsR family regulator
MDGLSDTELLIVSYVQSHAPEDCMLDKISLGIGKSRATVLKYLEKLYARGILDYRHIGRNKLWALKDSPVLVKAVAERPGPAARDVLSMAPLAFELLDVRYREDELLEGLDRPDIIVVVMTGDLEIVATNRLAGTRFPGAVSFRELANPAQLIRLERLFNSLRPGEQASTELDLRERPGVYRAYRITVFSREAAPGARSYAILGEDLTDVKKTGRQQDALLHIIRTAGGAKDERGLLQGVLAGVREKLLPFESGAVLMADMSIAYATPDLTSGLPAGLNSLVARCMSSLETVAGPVTGKFALVVPLITDEVATGALLLQLDATPGPADVENLEIVADEVSGGLKMLRLGRERVEHLNTLAALNKVSGIVNGTRDEGSMLEQSIKATMDALGFDMGCIYLKDEHDELALRVHRNMPESLRGMCLSGAFRPLFERAFAEHDVVYITAGSEGYEDLAADVRAAGVRTLLILPLRIGEDVVGLLNMGGREEKDYSPTSLDNIATIGLQLGLAVDRSKLALALNPDKNLT